MKSHFDELDRYFQSTIILDENTEESRISSQIELQEYLSSYQLESEGNDISDIMNHSFQYGTLLQMPARAGRDDLMCMFLRYGALINHTGDEGVTPLYVATEFRQLNVITSLIMHGANPRDFRDINGLNVIDLAMEMEYYDVLEIFIPNQTTSNATDPDSLAGLERFLGSNEAMVVLSSMSVGGMTFSGSDGMIHFDAKYKLM